MSAPRLLPPYLPPTIAHLFTCGAVRVEPKSATDLTAGFRLAFHSEVRADAPLAPCYVSLRVKGHKDGTLNQDLVGRIALALDQTRREMNLGRDPTWICGIPDAGTPFGLALSQMLTIQYLELGKRVGENGRREFFFVNGARPGPKDLVLICDDLISDAVVKEMVLELIAATGASVALVVFLDREQGGIASLRNKGYKVGASLTITELFDEGVRIQKMTPDVRDLCLSYPAKLRAWKAEQGIA